MSAANKIKVAIDCHKLEDKTGAHRAGIGRHLYRFLEEASKQKELEGKFKFYLYFKSGVPKDIPFLQEKIFVNKVAKLPFFFPFFRPSFNVFFHIAIPILALKDRIDVAFFASFMHPAFYIGKTAVVLTNDIYYESSQRSQPLKYRIGYKLFATWAAKRATTITTQTYASRKEISRCYNVPEDKIIVVPLGADFTEFTPEDNEKDNYILYVGQAFPRRHLRETINAFRIIAPEFPQLKFIAVGLDKYNPPIIDDLAKKTNKELGEERVIRKESVSDEELKELYRKAQTFVYISSSEAMGLPPLEALASGTVPVVADTPTTNEIFEDKAFFVENTESPPAIAEKIKRSITDNDRRNYILQNKDKILQKYTWKKHTDKMLELFKHTVQK